jgi:hypothetical protein
MSVALSTAKDRFTAATGGVLHVSIRYTEQPAEAGLWIQIRATDCTYRGSGALDAVRMAHAKVRAPAGCRYPMGNAPLTAGWRPVRAKLRPVATA